MRKTISGLVAVVAVMTAAPAMACDYGPCSPCGYSNTCGAPAYPAPIVNYGYTNGGCGGCGWVTERLPDPVQQYYYVNQGPTYTGPGNWAPVPTYQEGRVSYYRPWRHHAYHRHHYRYGYAPYYRGHRVVRRSY